MSASVRSVAGLVSVLALLVVVVVGCGGDDNPGGNSGGGGGSYTYTGGTKVIGGLTWMTENLNRETSNSWCYDDDNSNCTKYGRLYTWDAAMSACPSGWRLPTRENWNSLVTAVGGSSVAGSKLKSTSGWSSNRNGTNEFGFSALPGGFRNTYGSFSYAGSRGAWWSATELDRGYAYSRYMYSDYSDYASVVGEYNGNGKGYGFSVRCVR
jgi:uncharacterized protein (TIGR02145 family)